MAMLACLMLGVAVAFLVKAVYSYESRKGKVMCAACGKWYNNLFRNGLCFGCYMRVVEVNTHTYP